MSLLETFSILFDSNASQTDKEIGSALGNMAKNAVGTLGAFAAFGTIAHKVFEAANYADHLQEFSSALDLNIEEVDAWGNAVIMSGGNAQEFQGTIGNLARDMAAFAATGKGRVAPFFKELGINMVDANGKARDVMAVLPELADKFQGLTKQESFGLGQKLGLDQGTIMLLQSGRRAVEGLVNKQKELGTVTEEQADIAAKFNDEIDNTSHVLRTLFMSVGSEVLPVLSGFLKLIQKGSIWVREHTDYLKAFGSTMAIGMGVYAVGALWKFVKAAQAARTAALAAGAANAVFTAPLWLTIAAFAAFSAALALVIDDINTWAAGGDSMIGQWVGSFQEFEDAVFPIIDSLVEKITYLMGLWAEFRDKASMGLGDAAETVGGWITKGKDMLGMASETPIASQSSGAILAGGNTTKSNSVKIDNVNVQTQATDANGIAKDMSGSLQNQMAQTVAAFDDGVSH